MKFRLLFAIAILGCNAFAETSIPIKKQAVDVEKKGFFRKILDKVNIFSDEKEEVVAAKTVEKKKKINPAEKFPDPFFYDAIYKKSMYENSPIWLYNDKTNYENNHIPPIYNYKYVVDDIFPMLRQFEKTPELILLIESLSQRTDINLNKQDKFGNTLLHYAIRYNNKPIFEKLLSTNRINPNVCNYSYICPIHLAVYKQDSQEISQLVNYGADLKYANDRFEMPIVVAIRLNYYSTVYALARKHKERGVSINEIDYIIFTAKQSGLPDIADELYNFFMLDKEFDD